MRKVLFFLILIVSSSFGYSQQLESNSIYRIKNSYYTDYSLSLSNANSGAVGTLSDDDDLKQQWYVTASNDGKGYYFRNLFNGAYLTGVKSLYTQWTVEYAVKPDNDRMLFVVENYEGYTVFRLASNNDGYAYAHLDAAHDIVCWTPGSEPTRWNFKKVNADGSKLADMWKRFESTGDEIAKMPQYSAALEALFSDKACTQLKSGGSPMLSPDFKTLPATLKEMVEKIAIDRWDEENGNWNDHYARKYRVQLYEPYSEGAAAAGMAGIQAYTNMNNPTGILADAGEVLYVMVDSPVPSGASLYIGGAPDAGMYNNVTSGTELHEGLNMLVCNADNTLFYIYYTVNTVAEKKPVRNLRDYDPIKIHIEGGRINGFFNYVGDGLYKGDTREDFEYTSSRAVHPMYDLIGKYVILHFYLEDTPDTADDPNLHYGVKSCLDPKINKGEGKEYDPVKIMKSWDDMCFSERMVMGIQSKEDIESPYNRGMYSDIVGEGYRIGDYESDPDFYYSDYFNNRVMGITMQARGLYMNATSWRTAFAPSTMSAILTQFKHDALWGPAHEYGHINQTPMRIAGTTEESNNLFSNVALFFSENATTSRCNYISDQLNVFNDGKTYLENGTWGTTRMFWQLWCYYHATKHNTKFYPRLYELLRRYPLKRDLETIPGKLNPRYDLLHFAKMCCLAAGEDLTDFFTAWGFFVPLYNYHIDDYDVYDCVLTQDDIDAVKKEIADFGFEKNHAIILIDDRPSSDLPSEAGHPKEKAGEFGGLKGFIENQPAEGEFYYTLEGNEIKIEGEGNPGAGFLIYDNKGELASFSNSSNFNLSDQCTEDLMNGRATVYAVGCDNVLKKVSSKSTNDDNEDDTSAVDTLLDEKDGPIRIYDLSGRLITIISSENGKVGLSKGIYILRQGDKSKTVMIK